MDDANFIEVRRREVREALDDAFTPQRQVLEMAYLQAYTQVQIAEELGILWAP